MAKQSKLNRSWFDQAVRKVKLVTQQEVFRDRGYIKGIKEFRNRVIEELGNQIIIARSNRSGNIIGLLEAVELIKNLKA